MSREEIVNNIGYQLTRAAVDYIEKHEFADGIIMGEVKGKLREYNRSKNFLDSLCKAYFDATAPKGRNYIGWRLSDEYPNCIGIGYEYYDWKGEYQCYAEWVSISELENFNNK